MKFFIKDFFSKYDETAVAVDQNTNHEILSNNEAQFEKAGAC